MHPNQQRISAFLDKFNLDIFFIPLQEPRKKELILLTPIHSYLKAKGYNKWVGQWIIIEGVPVEFLPSEGLAKEAVDNAMETEFEGIKTKIIVPEYLVALLLKANRDKDKIKIEMLLKQVKIDREKLKGILSKEFINSKKFNVVSVIKAILSYYQKKNVMVYIIP